MKKRSVVVSASVLVGMVMLSCGSDDAAKPAADGGAGNAGSGGSSGSAGSAGSAGSGGAAGATDGGGGGPACVESEQRDCSELPDGTPIVWPAGSPAGLCAYGKQTCDATGTWGPCTGAIAPTPDVCDAVDNDCDTLVDNGDNAECATVYASAVSVAKWQCWTEGCVVGTCTAGSYDADKDPSNGCESATP